MSANGRMAAEGAGSAPDFEEAKKHIVTMQQTINNGCSAAERMKAEAIQVVNDELPRC